MNSRILQRGLLLLLVPVALQVWLFIQLSLLENKSDQLAKQVSDADYKVLLTIDQTYNPENAKGKAARTGKLYPNSKDAFAALSKLKKLAVQQRSVLEATKRRNESNRMQIRTQLIIGVVADLVIVIALLTFFLPDITGRLSILVENARRIPTRKPLIKQIEGDDEIAYLNSVLHSASNDLQMAAEHRKSVMQMLAHDLRAPLLSTTLGLDTLRLPAMRQSQELFDAKIDEMKRDVGSVVSLVEDLLTIDKLESGELDLALELFDISAVIDDTVRTFIIQADRKGVSITSDVGHQEVIADKRRIGQVITNLLSNAVKYSKQGGQIVISGRIERAELIVSVRDNGKGIAKDKLPNLFSKFFQLDSSELNVSKKGFGLGLSICKLIVVKHGGRVGVVSEEGKGATFWFSLPLDLED